MIGEISITKTGNAFVITEEEKYFIHKKNLGTCAEKDIVEFETKYYKGKQEAYIKKILKRYTDEFVGTITNNKNYSFVSTMNMGQDIYIPKGKTLKAKNGELVKVKIIKWGKKDKKCEAQVVKIYGKQDSAYSIINAKIESMHIEHKFSKEEIKEADKLTYSLKDELKYREDLRDLNHITIDGEKTKDFDDAVYLKKEQDKYILYVSIADVSHFVLENSILDNLAKRRGNSIYLYDRVIPMLPRAITNDLCSLKPNDISLAFTVKIELDNDATVLSSDVYKTVIINHRRYTYTEVNNILNNDLDDNNKEMLNLMKELSEKLSFHSRQRGSMEFEFPELDLVLGDEDKLIDIKLRERGIAELLIENFMILANTEIANMLYFSDIPAIYRIHEKPSLESMEELNKELIPLGYGVKNPSNLPTKLQSIIEKTKNTNEGYFLHKLILRSMKKAIYSKEAEGHFGLSLLHYLHFTSPIRRYADLLNHRILNMAITKHIKDFEKEKISKKLNSISKHISKTERDAQRLEYDAIDIKLAEYMKDKISTVYDARVSWIYNERCFVELSNYVEAELIGNDVYNLNDKIKVKVVQVDMLKGKIYVERV